MSCTMTARCRIHNDFSSKLHCHKSGLICGLPQVGQRVVVVWVGEPTNQRYTSELAAPASLSLVRDSSKVGQN